MDGTAEDDREILKRTLALYLGLAVLAVRAASRCLPVRLLVLWYLRRGEAVALQRVAELGSWPLYASLAQRGDGSLAEAARLARLFRTAARAVRKEIRWLARFFAPDHADPRAAISCTDAGVCGIQQRSASTVPLTPEPLDTS